MHILSRNQSWVSLQKWWSNPHSSTWLQEELIQNIWRRSLSHDSRMTRRWTNLEEAKNSGEMMLSWMWKKIKQKYQWILLREHTQEINAVSVTNSGKRLLMQPLVKLPFCYWLLSSSWVSQHLRNLPLQIALNWHRVVLSIFHSKPISLLMHVLAFFFFFCPPSPTNFVLNTKIFQSNTLNMLCLLLHHVTWAMLSPSYPLKFSWK